MTVKKPKPKPKNDKIFSLSALRILSIHYYYAITQEKKCALFDQDFILDPLVNQDFNMILVWIH